MSDSLKRNVRISVASLDVLSNLERVFPTAAVVAETRIVEMLHRSLRDDLTGLFNDVFFYERLGGECERYARSGAIVSLLMVDIDNFKKVNDERGHIEGDRVLRKAAAAIMSAVRKSDICCRYGGEEFAVVLPATTTGEAAALAEGSPDYG